MNADHVCWHPVGEKTMTSSVEFMLKSKYDALAAELAKNEAAYNKAAAGRNDILAGLRARVNVLESRDHCPCEDCKRARASESETTVKHPNCRNDLGICKWGCQKKCHLREMLDGIQAKLIPPAGTKGDAA